MAVGSGTVEAESHSIGSGVEEQNMGNGFGHVHLVWLEGNILVPQGGSTTQARSWRLIAICVSGDLAPGMTETVEPNERCTRIDYLLYP